MLMDFRKIRKFLRKNRYEKKLSIVRNTYAVFHRHEFGAIGKGAYLWEPIFLSGTPYIYLGNKVGIWKHARIEAIDEWEGQYFSPRLTIGDNVTIGQNCHITVAESIIIEKDTVCSARVTITDISHVTDNDDLAVLNQGIVTKPVRICEGAFIGINVTVLPGVTVGKHAVVGANSVVTKDVPDYATAVGVPAKIIKINGILQKDCNSG